MNIKSPALLERISKTTLYLAVLLVPLWFLPFTQNVLEYQKQILLLVLVFLGVIAWLAKTVSKGEIVFKKTWLHAGVFLLLLIFGIATLFSKWAYGSFWGLPLDVTDSFLSVFAFVLLYFLISNTISGAKELFRIFLYLVISGTISGIFTILQLHGFFLLPFARVAAFNTVGSANSVAVFLAVLLPMALVLSFVSRLLLRWFLWVLITILFLVIAFINFSDAWVVLMAGLFVLLLFGMLNLRKRADFGWVVFPRVLFVAALFFLVFRLTLPGTPVIPLEISPSLGAEFEIVKNVLKESPVIGSGPGTFVFDYARFHSPLLNQTIFWGTRFASGASELLDTAATKGALGILALFSLIGAAVFWGARTLVRQGKEQEGQSDISWMLHLGALSSLIGTVVAFALYPANFTLWFVFWICLGAVGMFLGGRLQKLSIAPSSSLAMVSSFVFLMVLIFGLGILFIGVQKYAAEVQYLKGIRASQQGDSDKATKNIVSAASLNPAIDTYWRDLAQLYLAQVNVIGGDTSLTDEERQQRQQVAIQNAVASSRQATAISPQNVANWNVQGFVYRNLIGIAGAEDAAIASYKRAIELEPASPFSFTELGRVYFLQAQRAKREGLTTQQDEALQKALEQLNRAVELKNDYSPARFLIATVFEEQGRINEAIAELEKAVEISPNDAGLAFQLGLVYYRQDRFTKAREGLERAKLLNPSYSNARYMLGLVYDRQGEADAAQEEFLAVARLNPDNTEVQRILENLRAGKPALQGITPAEPPIEEASPPELEGE